jgi:hypothetical protein
VRVLSRNKVAPVSEGDELELRRRVQTKILDCLGVPVHRSAFRTNVEPLELLSIEPNDSTLHVDWLDPFVDANRGNLDVQLGRNRNLSVFISLSDSAVSGLCFPSARDAPSASVHFSAGCGSVIIMQNLRRDGNIETQADQELSGPCKDFVD